MILVNAAVRENQNIRSLPVCTVHLHKQAVHGTFQRGALIICDRHGNYLEPVDLHVFDFQHIRVRQDRIVDFQNLTVDRTLFQQVSVTAHIDSGGGDNLLADRIDRRIGYLCKQLFEIVEQRLMLMGQHGQRVSTPMDAMPSEPFSAILRMEVRYSS